jgi:stage III sporulation protein AF
MQELVAGWAVSVAIAVIFSAVVSMLLPESGIKKYVSVVIGIVVTIIILSPVITLLSGADAQADVMNALKSAGSSQPAVPQSGSYKDYIYQIYEVYMGDD